MNITIISDSAYNQKGGRCHTLAKGLAEKNHKVQVFLPLYESPNLHKNVEKIPSNSLRISLPQGCFNVSVHITKQDGIAYYLISNSKLFGRQKAWGYTDDALRLMVFCTAVLEYLNQNTDNLEYILTDTPNTALITVLLKFKYNISAKFRNIKSYHYINYNTYSKYNCSDISSVFGISPENKQVLLCGNEVNLTKAAIICSSRILIGENAVSLLYDRNNIIHQTIIKFGFKIIKFRLGIDYNEFSPETDTDIHKKYSIENISDRLQNKLFVQRYLYLQENCNIPLIAIYTSNFSHVTQKIVREMSRYNIQLILLCKNGANNIVHGISDKFVCIQSQSAETLKNVFSASDFCVFEDMNSKCGNPCFISAAYGCVPVLPAHRFFDYGFTNFDIRTRIGNGFTFEQGIENDVLSVISNAIGLYKNDKKSYNILLSNTMKKIFSASESIEAIERQAVLTPNF